MFDEILAQLWFTTRGRYIGLSLLALAGLLFVATLLHTFSAWYGDVKLGHVVAMHDQSGTDESDAALVAKLSTQHLFGAAEDVPITSLQLHLNGILQTAHSADSKVIIASDGQSGKTYKVGDVLPSGLKIYAINATDVELEQNGRIEKLPLVREPLTFQDKPREIG